MPSEDTPEIAEDLAACPVCQGLPRRNGRMGTGGVLCASTVPVSHRVQVYGGDQAEADAAWNTRPTPPKVAGDAEELAGRLERIAAQQREQRGDMMTYGTVDPWLSDAIAHIRSTAAEIATLREERDALKAAKWDVRHVDTMNDMVLMALARDDAEAARLAAERGLAAAVMFVQRMDGILPHISAESGVCCCGDNMEQHAHPMSAGHSPTDSGAYAVSIWQRDARAFLATKENPHAG